MSRTILIALCGLVMLTASLAVPSTSVIQAQTAPDLSLITEFQVPGSGDVKYPHVVAYGNEVNVSGNANRTSAFLWTKPAATPSFPAGFEFGPAGGQPDYSTTSVARGPDGTIYVAWTDQPSHNVYLRQRTTTGIWGPMRLVHRGGGFCCVSPEVGVSGTNQIFVVWRDSDRPLSFKTSQDGGVNWSNTNAVSADVAYSSPVGLAAGPNGAMAITFTAGAGGSLHIFFGLWNSASSAFVTERVTTQSGDYADSSVTIDPNGKIYVAWRGVAESGGNSGVFYAERTSTGSWPRSRLIGGKVAGTVNVSSDERGNLHFSWLGEPSGGRRTYYSIRAVSTGEFKGPLEAGSGVIFNSHASASIFDAAYNHVVLEDFTGAGLRTRYVLFKANVVSLGGEPVIGDGTGRTSTNPDGTVRVSFKNVNGSPNQFRYAWNRAPTDADPWLTFTTTLNLPVPASILNSTTCAASTLYTQLRNTVSNQVETQPRTAVALIDNKVSASVMIDSVFSQNSSTLAGLTSIAGAPISAPNYTRVPVVYLRVTPEGDCTGLTSLGVGSTPSTIETSYPITTTGFSGIVPLPNLVNLVPGKVNFYVHVTDGVGNRRVYPVDITFDEDKPVLNSTNSGTARAVADAKGDILQDLVLTNIRVSDAYTPADLDPNRHFWGVWVAESPDDLTDPLNAGLKWIALQAPASVAQPNGDYTVTIQDWSLATGLSGSQLAPGDFFIYVRFLDAAGNATDNYIRIPIALSNMNRPKTHLPVISR